MASQIDSAVAATVAEAKVGNEVGKAAAEMDEAARQAAAKLEYERTRKMALDAESDERLMAALFSGSAEDKEASVASPGEGEATRAATSDAAGSSQKSSAAGIEAVLEYRVFKGNEQWRVRWEEQAESWEMWPVLDTDALRNHAEALRQSSA